MFLLVTCLLLFLQIQDTFQCYCETHAWRHSGHCSGKPDEVHHWKVPSKCSEDARYRTNAACTAFIPCERYFKPPLVGICERLVADQSGKMVCKPGHGPVPTFVWVLLGVVGLFATALATTAVYWWIQQKLRRRNQQRTAPPLGQQSIQEDQKQGEEDKETMALLREPSMQQQTEDQEKAECQEHQQSGPSAPPAPKDQLPEASAFTPQRE
eukprot:TRINITY_DN61296_c0_g1_i1.p2 TRINITY_DN61296_c0_g1~~TRINITY_DN61296_c0_g1_i1.p2  ORF type:complete len:211 (+),score=21.42 TRINITY_DN61296_c0_g1_i1:40-672(+)